MSEQEVIIKSLKDKLLSVLKIDDFWKQFEEVVGQELALQREEIEKKKDLYNVDVQLEDGLKNIAEMFGYTPNLIIDNSLQMTRKEVESIPYRIRNKTTYDGYYINFKQINWFGDIYNYYWSDKKLIRAVLDSDILDALSDTSLYTLPFTRVTPDKNFSTIASNLAVTLDANYNLDERVGQIAWKLDSAYTVLPTKHLGVEYYVVGVLDNGYLITSDYFRYMEKGVNYTRRTPIIPHVGVQLSSIIAENSGFDFWNTGSDYTVPLLKLKSCTTLQYNKAFVSSTPFFLDEDTPLVLDTLPQPWILDTDTDVNNRPTAKDFFYISCGNRSLFIPDEAHKDIFYYSYLGLFYTFSDSDFTYSIKDFSQGNYSATLTGNTKKIEGIIGKTVNFDGDTSLTSDSKIPVLQEQQTLGFWFNANSKNTGISTPQYIFDFSLIKMWYVYSEEKMYCEIDSSITSNFTISKDTVYFIMLELDEPSGILSIYANNVLMDSIDISSVIFSGRTFYLTIGADSNKENNFVGIIDSFWILARILTPDEKAYIYDNKLGIITHLGNRLAEYVLDTDHENFELESIPWMIIQSYIKANDITDELGFFIDSAQTVYSGRTNFFPIESKYFEFTYIDDEDTSVLVKADKNGNFYKTDDAGRIAEKISGDINYQTGEYNIYTLTERYVTQEIIGGTQVSIETVARKTLTADSSISYYNIVDNQLELLPQTDIITIDETREIKEVKEYTVTGENTTVFNDGTKEEGVNIYFEDVFCETVCDPQPEVNPNFVAVYEFFADVEIITPDYNYSGTLGHTDIKKKSLVLSYKINGENYTAIDDGDGNIKGYIGDALLFSGNIDYSSGTIQYSLDEGYYPDGDVLISYTFYESLNVKDGSNITFRYKVTDSTNITEIGLENYDHELLAYMTFPPIQFNSIDNHVSVMFAIKKIY